MRERINNYKNCMVDIFEKKYHISEFQAKKLIREYDFNTVLRGCNYIALHDDPESWVDEIYQWSNEEQDLLEM
jgi:hypothetical protein